MMQTTTKPLTVEMAFAKSTKGTHVCAALDAGAAAVTTIYVQKTAFPKAPAKLTLTIAAAPEGPCPSNSTNPPPNASPGWRSRSQSAWASSLPSDLASAIVMSVERRELEAAFADRQPAQ